MSRKVLITGFQPFGDETINPTEFIANALDGETLREWSLEGRTLPVVFGRAREQLDLAIETHAPDLVLCLGLAANRKSISLERVALNIDDASIPDNEGQQPIDRVIEVDGPAAYWSTLPIKAMKARLEGAGYLAEISQSAGTYVCNHLFYGLMHSLRLRAGVRGGFVHIPRATGVWTKPKLVAAIRLAIETALVTETDLKNVGGTIS